MKLQKLISDIQYAVIRAPFPIEETEVAKVVYDSRKADKGDMFVCLEGEKTDGHAYIGEAADRGVSVLVVEKLVLAGKMISFPEDAAVLLVKDTREALAHLGAAFFGYPSRKLRVIGVTGTKGKTTVTVMIHQMLQALGHRAGLIGTIETIIGEERISSRNTTPESFTIQEYFAKMIENGCEYAVMEVSSQGIRQKRVEGIEFEIGIFTNFGADHVGPGEHASMGEYRYYKSLLFRQCRIGIGNLDDSQCGYMFRRSDCEKYGFSCQSGGIVERFCRRGRVMSARRIQFLMGESGPETWFEADGRECQMQLPGLFNVYNALAALQAIWCLGLDLDGAVRILPDVRVKGRMERILTDKNIACYVDYAHNAMSLQNVLTTLRMYNPDRIILVFGCGGNRSVSRRLEMGEMAGRLADLTIVTSDNPRFEEPGKIISDILEGICKGGGNYLVIEERPEAIAYAVEEARRNDVVLIAGKGHEDYQEICGVRYPMDDRTLVLEAAGMKERQAECTQTLL